MEIPSSIDFGWADWFFSHEITPFAKRIFETMYKRWCSLNMCHRIQLHMKKSKRIVNYFVGVAPVTGVLYWRKNRQTDLFCFISFCSLEFMCFIHFHLQFSCTGIDENYEFSNARQIVRKWEKSRMLLPISQLVLHVISKWRRLRIKIDNKNVSFYKLCDLFRRLVVIRTQRSYGDNLFVQSIYIFKKRWYKKKLNKCLPQHIKLNIYLHLKRAEKKSGQALNTLVLCCVYAWSSVLIQRKKTSMLFALHIAKTLQKLKRSHKIMVR